MLNLVPSSASLRARHLDAALVAAPDSSGSVSGSLADRALPVLSKAGVTDLVDFAALVSALQTPALLVQANLERWTDDAALVFGDRSVVFWSHGTSFLDDTGDLENAGYLEVGFADFAGLTLGLVPRRAVNHGVHDGIAADPTEVGSPRLAAVSRGLAAGASLEAWQRTSLAGRDRTEARLGAEEIAASLDEMATDVLDPPMTNDDHIDKMNWDDTDIAALHALLDKIVCASGFEGEVQIEIIAGYDGENAQAEVYAERGAQPAEVAAAATDRICRLINLLADVGRFEGCSTEYTDGDSSRRSGYSTYPRSVTSHSVQTDSFSGHERIAWRREVALMLEAEGYDLDGNSLDDTVIDDNHID